MFRNLVVRHFQSVGQLKKKPQEYLAAFQFNRLI